MILHAVVSILAISGFGFVIWRSNILKVVQGISQDAVQGIEAILDRELSDEAKETAVQQAGLKLVIGAFQVSWRLFMALAAAAVPIYLSDGVGITSAEEVIALMLRVDYIVIVSLFAIVVVEFIRRSQRCDNKAGVTEVKVEKEASSQYSATDRFFHAFAFSSLVVLKASSWCEDRLFRSRSFPVRSPVFITSLARGGTTALLNALYDVPCIATHIYRDMPFVTAPLLWRRLTGGRRVVARRRRAHGDGLEIDLDSPEAFEEVLWRLFWGEKYGERSITLWGSQDRKTGAEDFITRQMSKVMAARQKKAGISAGGGLRYCSKNNANIARLDLLPVMYPEAKIIIPVRLPGSHAASLLRQHQNFKDRHTADEFVRRYMRDIGHFEFGLLHKPFLFPGFEAGRYEFSDCNYWLDYWVHAYDYVCDHADRCIIVLQDDLRQFPNARMQALLAELGLPAPAAELDFSNYFRHTPDLEPDLTFDASLMAEARVVYENLELHARRSFAPDLDLVGSPNVKVTSDNRVME